MAQENVINLVTGEEEAHGRDILAYPQNQRSILKMSSQEAKSFLLKSESYCNFDLPPYFKFDALIKKIDNKLNGKELSSFLSRKKIRDCEGVNHILLNNKNGK